MSEQAPYDSRPETLFHSLRVGGLIGQLVKQLVGRMTQHDLSKTEQPELAGFDQFTPMLRTAEYGSPEYGAQLAAMAGSLEHHYANNRHHPEHYRRGIRGMTLPDLIELLADCKAATERVKDGDLASSMRHNLDRFGMSDDLFEVLWNTAREAGWIRGECGATVRGPGGDRRFCGVRMGEARGHDGEHVDRRHPDRGWTDTYARDRRAGSQR